MTFPTDLTHFRATEFRYPDLMDIAFLRWLDRVRARAGVPFIITSDARPSGGATGGSATSLHKRGRAVDLRTRHWTAIEKWAAAAAIMALAPDAPGSVEFELVHSATDRHWHLGVDDRAAGHELIEADE
jgi:hypothetical protein